MIQDSEDDIDRIAPIFIDLSRICNSVYVTETALVAVSYIGKLVAPFPYDAVLGSTLDQDRQTKTDGPCRPLPCQLYWGR